MSGPAYELLERLKSAGFSDDEIKRGQRDLEECGETGFESDKIQIDDLETDRANHCSLGVSIGFLKHPSADDKSLIEEQSIKESPIRKRCDAILKD
jgi:hypothetical protein